MHQIGVVGLSYRHVGVDEVARFSVPKTDVAARLPALRDALGVSEVFYVGTCNRVEILFAMPDGAHAGDARSKVFRALIGREPVGGEATRILRAWTGEAAVEHLFLVTCGLDSAQAGEQEIAAQIRLAWATAREARVCGPTLDKLLREALSMAHRVHKLEANVRTPSLADLAADRIIGHFNDKPATVALVGVSPMTKRCGMILHRAGIPLLVVNRTLQSAEEYAATVGGRAVQLDEFRAAPLEVGALVLAAGGSEPVLDARSLSKVAAAAGARKPLLLDFGVPPNADPNATRAAGIARVGMDDLIQAAQERRLSQLMRLAPVRAAVDERLNRLRSDLATRAIGRRLAELRGSFEQIAAEETERALAEEFNNLDATQRELLQKFASTVARRLAHLPLAGMRAAAAHASSDAVDAFFREAKLRRSANGYATSRWRPDLDTGEPGGSGWKADADSDERTGPGWKHADSNKRTGPGWKPDANSSERAGPGWKADTDSNGRTSLGRKHDPNSNERTGPGWKHDADSNGRTGSGWKPDADSNEWTGAQRRVDNDAVNGSRQHDMLGGEVANSARRLVMIGTRATDVIPGRWKSDINGVSAVAAQGAASAHGRRAADYMAAGRQQMRRAKASEADATTAADGVMSEADATTAADGVMSEADATTAADGVMSEADATTAADGVMSEADVMTDADAVMSEADVMTDADAVMSKADAMTDADGLVSEADATTDADGVMSEADVMAETDGVMSEADVMTDADGVMSEADATTEADGVMSEADALTDADGVMSEADVMTDADGEASDADAVTTQAEPMRAGWAKD